MKLLFLIISVALAGSLSASGQVPPPPPPPMVKPTPADKSELSDAELERKILESIAKPIAWKQYSPPGFEIGIDMPREPVRQIESFYDESVGNTKIDLYLSLGEGSSFVVGRMPMPYSISDPKLIREMFEEVAKELMSDPATALKYVADYELNGHLGVELRSVPKDGYIGALFRGVVIGKAVYMIHAAPHHSPGEDNPLTKAELEAFRKEQDRFLTSIALKANRVTPVTSASTNPPVPPVFRGTFANGVFRSEYFKFSLSVPTDWIQVSAEDVEGIRQVGRDYVAATSDLKMPQTKARQNIATFVSKPLGSDGIAMIALNIGPKSSSLEDVLKLAEMTEGVISKLPTYEIRKRPTATQVGGSKAYTLETTIRMAAGNQHQVIYFLQRRDHLLAFVVTYFSEADRKPAVLAVENLKLEAL